MLYIAKHKETGLFSKRLNAFLLDNQSWIKCANPTIEEIVEEIELSNQHSSMWVSDIQEAEPWDEYYINRWKEYLPDVEFVKVQIQHDED